MDRVKRQDEALRRLDCDGEVDGLVLFMSALQWGFYKLMRVSITSEYSLPTGHGWPPQTRCNRFETIGLGTPVMFCTYLGKRTHRILECLA